MRMIVLRIFRDEVRPRVGRGALLGYRPNEGIGDYIAFSVKPST